MFLEARSGEVLVGVGGDQVHSGQAAGDEVGEEAVPRSHDLTRRDTKPEHFAASVALMPVATSATALITRPPSRTFIVSTTAVTKVNGLRQIFDTGVLVSQRPREPQMRRICAVRPRTDQRERWNEPLVQRQSERGVANQVCPANPRCIVLMRQSDADALHEGLRVHIVTVYLHLKVKMAAVRVTLVADLPYLLACLQSLCLGHEEVGRFHVEVASLDTVSSPTRSRRVTPDRKATRWSAE